MLAMLFHARADDVGQERFGDQTCLGMPTRRCRERTAVAADKVFAFTFVEASRAAHVLENGKRRLNPSFTVFRFQLRQVIARDRSSYFTQSRPEFLRRQPFRKYG